MTSNVRLNYFNYKLNNNSEKYVQFETLHVQLWLQLYAKNITLGPTNVCHIEGFESTKMTIFLLSDWLLEMKTSPSVAQYTWPLIKYKISISTRNGDMMMFWKNSDDILRRSPTIWWLCGSYKIEFFKFKMHQWKCSANYQLYQSYILELHKIYR